MMKKNTALLLILLFHLLRVSGQPGKQIVINTEKTSLIFSVGQNGRLYQHYLGNKLTDTLNKNGDAHEAYVPSGVDNLFEPAIRMVHGDGNPSLVLNYKGVSVDKKDDNVTTTAIHLKDPVYPAEVILYFTSYYKENIIKSWTEIINNDKKPVMLTDFASAMINFDANKYWLTQFHGDWAEEVQMRESQLTSGIKILDSKLGTRPEIYQTPAFFLALDNQATENSGELIAGTLAWTGNFQLKFEVDGQNSLRLIAGINPFASSFLLQPGKSFITPEFIFTYSSHGKGEASRNLHAWARNYGIMDGNKPRLTLLNNWETTEFDFNEARLSGLLDDAAKLGVSLFLLDDGWFGNKYPRINGSQGLGDWSATKSKLPNGFASLVKTGEAKRVKFGIWIEPEMVNAKSEFYEKHPDWVLRLPNRADSHVDNMRDQYVVDLINPKVQDFVFNIVDDLFTQNPGLAYIKWDCNTVMTNAWSPYLKSDQSTLFVEYTKCLYKVLDRIRQKYPHVPMMLCSGGGARADYGALKYFTEFWPSDNTYPADRIYIQWGYSYFFPSLAMCNHITLSGKESLKYKTDVAMMGKAGYDLNIHQLSADEIWFSQQALKNYDRLSKVIWQGDLYRLVSPYDENRAVLSYVNAEKTQAVLFSYNLHLRFNQLFEKVLLQGLDPAKRYQVSEINLEKGKRSYFSANGKTFTGEYLQQVGLDVSPYEAFTSAVFEINEIP